MIRTTAIALAATLALSAPAMAQTKTEAPAPADFCQSGTAPSTAGLTLGTSWGDGKGYDATYNGGQAYVWGLNGNTVTGDSAIETATQILGCWVGG